MRAELKTFKSVLRSWMTVPLLASVIALLLTACGGGGGGGGSSPSTTPNPGTVQTTTTSVVPAIPNNNATATTCPTLPSSGAGTPPVASALRGRITFDRVPFATAPVTQYDLIRGGLDYAHPQVLPARGVVVEAVAASAGSCTGNVLDTTVTDGDGWYGLNVSQDQTVCVRARAQLYRADAIGSNWNLSVVDNTDGNQMYAMADGRFAPARSVPRRDLHAASGLINGIYADLRVAAPFAILDTACKAMDAILLAQPGAQFGDMTFRWSINNTESSSGALTAGQIGGAFYSPAAQAVYLRGDVATNTDEFDEMVIAHEFGHFVTHRFSRADSLGGDHSLLDQLDPRVAFDEGWATAFAGLVLRSRIYRDSDELGNSREFYFFLDDSSVWPKFGWFGENSVQNLIYAFGETESNDGVALGFGAIWQVFSGDYKNSAAMQSVFSFGSVLKAAHPAEAGAIAALLNTQHISGDTIDAFAGTEVNAWQADAARDLPVYQELNSAAVQRVCSRNEYAIGSSTTSSNKLSMTRYLRFDAPAVGNFLFTVTPERNTGLAGLEIFQQGRYIQCDSGSSNVDSLQDGISVQLTCPLQQASYVIAVRQTDFTNDINAQNANYDQCFQVKVETQ